MPRGFLIVRDDDRDRDGYAPTWFLLRVNALVRVEGGPYRSWARAREVKSIAEARFDLVRAIVE